MWNYIGCSEPVSYAAVEEDRTGGLNREVYDAPALMLYFFLGCPQSCMPNPVEGLLEVYEDMVKVFLVLEILKFSHRGFLG